MIKSAEEFKKIFDMAVGEERSRLKEPADDATWLDIIHNFPELETEVLNNNSISGLILEELAKSKDVEVRYDVAMKRRNTKATFELLAKDPNPSVRHCIACNTKVPRDILVLLSTDTENIVAQAAHSRLES